MELMGTIMLISFGLYGLMMVIGGLGGFDND